MNEQSSYWQRYWRRRLSRRGLLRGAAIGTAGLAAAAVVGCGDDEEGAAPTTPAATTPGATTPGATATATATATPAPVQGGIRKASATRGPPTLDPDKTNSYLTRIANTGRVYSKLYSQVGVPFTEPERYPPTVFAGDAAESLPEITDDGLTYIIKLRNNVKYHPPTSRFMDSEDVVQAWKRMKGELDVDPSPSLGALSNIDTFTAIDALTVRITLTSPLGTFINRLADDFHLALVPKEIGTAFDPLKTMVGSGPWMFKEDIPSVSNTYLRNPEWHQAPGVRPYIDQIDTAIVPEASLRLTQFLDGKLDSQGILPADLKRVLETFPDGTVYGSLSGYSVGIGFSGIEAGPWNDPLVRQAISLALDRDALFDALYDPAKVEAAGLEPPEVKWHSHINLGFGGFGRDTRTDAALKEFFGSGDRAKDIADAKQLLEDAGYGGGFTVNYHYTKDYGANWTLHAELMQQMLADIGINAVAVVEPIRGDYYTKTFLGNFDGLGVFYFTQTEAGDLLEQVYVPGGSRNFGKIDDPSLTAKINAIQIEGDSDERKQMILDIQDELAQKMYYVPGIHDTGPSWTVWNPRIKNAGQHLTIRGGTGDNTDANIWIAS